MFLLATQKYQVAPACIPSQQSYNHNISGGCQIKIGQIQYRLGIKQKKDSQSIVELTGDLEYQTEQRLTRGFTLDLRIVDVAGIKFKVTGVGPLNWVLKVMVVKNLKKALRSFVLLRFKEELERIFRRESLIEKLYIPILERKFSRK